MQATELLKHEHQVILLVLGAAEREAAHIAETGEVRAQRVADMLEVFTNFADRCHHAKEEDVLFVKLAERDPAIQAGPIAVMLREHDEGRAHLRAVQAAVPQAAVPRAVEGDAAAAEVVRRGLADYAALLRDHIDKEDNILYPLADRVLGAEEQAALSAAFDAIEAEEIGAGVHERYHAMAHALAEG